MTENPYAAPSTSPEIETPHFDAIPPELASRWARLGANILDGIIMLALFLPLFFMLVFFELAPGVAGEQDFLDELIIMGETIIGQVIFALIGIGVYLAVNGYLMVKSGQTVGKKILSIQVVDYDTKQLLPVSKIIGIRYILTTLITNVPGIGTLFFLVDSCFIFGAEKRCIHDHMAGSTVINKIW